MVLIREMREEDIPEKARVHAATWQETYAEMLPDELNAKITPAFAERVTRALPNLRTLVAEKDGQIVGYASYQMPCREFYGRVDAAELCNLYVLRAWQGRGIGGKLVSAVCERVMARCGAHGVLGQRAGPGILSAPWLL